MKLFLIVLMTVQTGEKLVNFLVEPKKGTKWPKKLPKFKDRTEATAVCKELCNLQYLLRCEKLGKGELGVSVVHFCAASFPFFMRRNPRSHLEYF